MKRYLTLLLTLSAVVAGLFAPATMLAASLEVVPVCVDDEGEFVWTVSPSEDGELTAAQGTGQSITVPVKVGDENMVIVGLAGEGDVTFTLADAVVTLPGPTNVCYAPDPEDTVGVSTTGEVSSGYLPPTDTEAEAEAAVGMSFVGGAVMGATIVALALMYAAIRYRGVRR